MSEAGSNHLDILVPVDFSRGTEEWIAEGLSKLSNVHGVELLHVIPLNMSEVSEFVTEDVVEKGKEIAEGRLKDLMKVIGTLGSYEMSYEIAVGDPAEMILEQASTGRFDMVMMGHRGFGYVKEFFIGSVTLKVISKSPVPVLVVRKK
ncbi:MAG: universal stress protein [Conexivisphaerales archaeon]|nr:universal stress protein [Conexivisphaerales archaeon]